MEKLLLQDGFHGNFTPIHPPRADNKKTVGCLMHEKSTCFDTVVLDLVHQPRFCLPLSIGLGRVLAPYKCPSIFLPFLYSFVSVCFIICFLFWSFVTLCWMYSKSQDEISDTFGLELHLGMVWREVGETGKQLARRLKQFTWKTSLVENWNWKLGDIIRIFYFFLSLPGNLRVRGKPKLRK